ncbi:hypothetical protein TrST_g2097 [Triparma strigata]|uniref:Core-binding (CB) domain-containing protein n=2 Tax=Triparma strigata TaxID=1606541 RepID=A0A9W7BMP7_9STRA|nr:hypothetical protein TrST_g2097 [Triparma strigata]
MPPPTGQPPPPGPPPGASAAKGKQGKAVNTNTAGPPPSKPPSGAPSTSPKKKPDQSPNGRRASRPPKSGDAPPRGQPPPEGAPPKGNPPPSKGGAPPKGGPPSPSKSKGGPPPPSKGGPQSPSKSKGGPPPSSKGGAPPKPKSGGPPPATVATPPNGPMKGPPSMWTENGGKETKEVLQMRNAGLQALAAQTRVTIAKQEMPAPMFLQGEPGALPSLQPKGVLSDSSTISALSVDSALNDTGSISVPTLANATSEDTTVVDNMTEEDEPSPLDTVLAMMTKEEIRQKEEWAKFEEEKKQVKKTKKGDRKQAEEDLDKKQEALYAGWVAKNKELRGLLETCQQHDRNTDALRVEEIEHDLATTKAQHESDAAALQQAKAQLEAKEAEHASAKKSIDAKLSSLKTAMRFAQDGNDKSQLANIEKMITETKAKEEKLVADQSKEKEALAKAVQETEERIASSKEVMGRKQSLLEDSTSLKEKEKKSWTKWFSKKKLDVNSDGDGEKMNAVEELLDEEEDEGEYDDGRSVTDIYKDMQNKENLQRLAWDGMQKKQVELTEELDAAAKKGDRKKVEAIIGSMRVEKETVDAKVGEWEEANFTLRKQLDVAQTRELREKQGDGASTLSKAELKKIKSGQIDAMQRKALEKTMVADLAKQLEETRKQLQRDASSVSNAQSGLDLTTDRWCISLNNATDKIAELNAQLANTHSAQDTAKEESLIEQIRKLEEEKAKNQAAFDEERAALTKELSVLQTSLKANEDKSKRLKHLIEDLGQTAVATDDVTEMELDNTPSDAMIEAAKPVKFKKWTKDGNKRPEHFDPNYVEVVPEMSPQELVISQIKAAEREQMMAWRQLELRSSALNRELEKTKVNGGDSLKVMQAIKALEEEQKELCGKWQKANVELKQSLDDTIRRDQEMKKHYERVDKAHLSKTTNMLTFAQQEQQNEIKEQLSLLAKSLEIAQRNHDEETVKSISLSILRVEEGLRTIAATSGSEIGNTQDNFQPKGLKSPLHLATKAKNFFWGSGKKKQQEQDESGVLSDEEGEEGAVDDDTNPQADSASATDSKGAVLQTQLNTLDQQLRVLEKKRVESMTKYDAVNEVLMEEIEEQKLIRKMAKSTEESAQDKMARRTKAKLVIDKLRDFKMERENTEKTFESHKLNIMGEMLKLRAQLFKNSSWRLGDPGKGGGAVNGSANIEDQAGGEMYELEDNGQFVASPTNKGSFKQNWEPKDSAKEYKKLSETSPLRKRVTQMEAWKASMPPQPIKSINLNESMNSSVNLSLEIIPFDEEGGGPKELQNTAFSLGEALRGTAGSPSNSSMHLLTAMKTRALPSITTVARMGKKVEAESLNQDQKFNRANLDQLMRPLVELALQGKEYATAEGITGDLVDFLCPLDGESWSAHNASLMDLISIKAEIGLCPQVCEPPGKITYLNALELVISGEESRDLSEWRQQQKAKSGSRMMNLNPEGVTLTEEDRNALDSIKALQKKLTNEGKHDDIRVQQRRQASEASRRRMKEPNAPKQFSPVKKKEGGFFGLDFSSDPNHSPGKVNAEPIDFTSPRKAKVLKEGYAVNHLNLSPAQAEELRDLIKDELVLQQPIRRYKDPSPNHMSPNIENVGVSEADVLPGVTAGLIDVAMNGGIWAGNSDQVVGELKGEKAILSKLKKEDFGERLYRTQTKVQKMRLSDGFNYEINHGNTLRSSKTMGREDEGEHREDVKEWNKERNKHRKTAESKLKKEKKVDIKFRTVDGILGELESSVVDSNGNLLAHDYEDSILHEPADSEDIIPAAMSYKLTPEEKSLKMKAKKAMERRKKKELAQRLEASKKRLEKKASEVI